MVTYLESDLQVIPGTGTYHLRVRRQRVRLIDNRTTQFAYCDIQPRRISIKNLGQIYITEFKLAYS